MKKKLIYALLLGVFLSVGSMAVAWAQEDSEDYQEMMRLSEEGHKLYEAGDLEGAAKLYGEAYDAYPQAVLLKNQMVTRYLLEDCAKSIAFGQSFLETEESTADDVEEVNTVFGECSIDLATAAVEEEDWGEARRWLEFGEVYFKEIGLEDEAKALQAQLDEAASAEEEEEVLVVAPPPSEAGGGLSGMQIGGWSLTVLGSGVLVWAAIWNVQGLGEYNELREGAEDGTILENSGRAKEMTESINRARMMTPILYGVGGASLAAGVAMLILPALSKDKDSAALTVAPMISPDVQGASLRLRF